MFSLYTFYQPLQPFKNLTKLDKVGMVGKPLVSETPLYIFFSKKGRSDMDLLLVKVSALSEYEYTFFLFKLFHENGL